MREIEISHMGKNNGNPDLVCESVCGHGRTVSSPYGIFFLDKFEQAVNQYFVHIHSF